MPDMTPLDKAIAAVERRRSDYTGLALKAYRSGNSDNDARALGDYAEVCGEILTDLRAIKEEEADD